MYAVDKIKRIYEEDCLCYKVYIKINDEHLPMRNHTGLHVHQAVALLILLYTCNGFTIRGDLCCVAPRVAKFIRKVDAQRVPQRTSGPPGTIPLPLASMHVHTTAPNGHQRDDTKYPIQHISTNLLRPSKLRTPIAPP